MLNSTELIFVARQMLDDAQTVKVVTDGFPDAHLRRVVSTAYYALFHTVTVAAAERFVGSDHAASPAYRLIHRGFEHRRMRDVCRALQTARLAGRYPELLGRSEVSQSVRDFADGFIKLQDARHEADYDPAKEFFHLDAAGLVDVAGDAIQAFEQIPTEEQRDILALMLVGARG